MRAAVGMSDELVSAARQEQRKLLLSPDGVLRWLMPAPAVILLAAFTLIPLLRTIYLGFASVKYGRDVTWIGLGNYQQLLTDDLFLGALANTFVFVALAVVSELILGFAIALLLWGEVSRWRSVFRTLFMIPMVLSPVVVGITWRALLNPNFGWINHLVGIPGFQWLSDPNRALFTLAAVDVWQWTPFMFVILLSGLQGVPADVLEAAEVDGASSVRRFVDIVWPLMLPFTIVAVLLRAIDAFKIFDLVYNLTGGGPGTATETISFYLYRIAFKQFDLGYAAAVSVVLSVIVGVLVTGYLRLARRLGGETP
jgi:multiple sugar transport system permease protein